MFLEITARDAGFAPLTLHSYHPYQGQSMFLEIMREMKAPRHFPRAVLAANGAMLCGLTLTLTK